MGKIPKNGTLILGGDNVTKLLMKSGINAWTTLTPDEVSHYLNKGIGTGFITGYADEAGTISIYISAHAIEFIYR